jgi:hypothetical protein
MTRFGNTGNDGAGGDTAGRSTAVSIDVNESGALASS